MNNLACNGVELLAKTEAVPEECTCTTCTHMVQSTLQFGVQTLDIMTFQLGISKISCYRPA